jgi:hypothetical protein
MSDPTRREVFESVSKLGVAALLPGILPGCRSAGGRAFAPRNGDLVREENAKPGTSDWMLRKTRVDPATKYRCPWIEGYFSQASARAGDVVGLHVSTNPASRFTVDLYRLGCYGGKGGRLVASLGSFPGLVQEDPPIGQNRLRECRWEPAARIAIPKDWPSGVYLAKLTAEREGLESYATLVVRDDRACDVLVQCSDTTWHAYNRWPSQYSIYDDGKSQWYWGAGVDVSFDRPYGKYCQILDQPLSQGSGEFLLWEFPLAFWLEEQGVDVSYVSNLDTHADAAGLRRAKGFLSVGHDEYYSLPMFHNLRGAIADGLSVAFLSGNTCCGLLEVLPSSDGRPDRVIRRVDRFGPRDATGDRIFDRMKTLPRAGPNEATLIGARSTGTIMGGAPYYCSKPGHWLFEGTGMKEGDGVPGLVGWEWHGDPAGIPGLEIVSKGETKFSGGNGVYTSTVYPGPKGNFVFNAATCWWSDGLSAPPGYKHPSAHGASPQGPDPRVQRMTANLIRRMRSV